MSNSFNNFLSPTVGKGLPILKDYQHASKLYVAETYARAPKVGFLYFINFNINPGAVIDDVWLGRGRKDVGLLVKKIDMPKFTITTETLNQYNRKTVVQTKLNYSPISVEFHDDNSDITQDLWVNYYKHYYVDSNYGDSTAGKLSKDSIPTAFSDTKYGTQDNEYGRFNGVDNDGEFFSSIDIYVLHQHQFTQVTLINPKITEWSHDSLNQAEGNKTLQNRMQVAYESVIYKKGQIVPGHSPENFAAVYYDKEPSPLSIAGNPRNNPTYTRAQTAFDQPGAARIFGKVGGSQNSPNALLDIGKILLKDYINKNGLGKAGAVGYNIAGGVLGAVTQSNPGKYAAPVGDGDQTGIINLPGGVGINIFKGFNTSVDGKVRANPAAILFPK